MIPVLTPNEAVAQARLAQHLAELLQRRAAAIGEPPPARAVDAASLDPRLPSRHAMDGLAQSGSAGPASGGPGRSAVPPADPTPALSAAARALAALLYRSGSDTVPPVRAVAPLWLAAGPPAGPVLAQALESAARESGLFYESHLQEVAGGTRALAQLRLEPQAALAPADPAAAGPVLHPATVDLVRQQLELIESGIFRWRGEAWPGAPLEWDIRDERGQDDGPPGEASRAWSTRVRLVLPALGAVEARLELDKAGGLQLGLAARQEASACLQEHRAGLLLRLQAAGTTVLACDIGATP
ncbi:flagellar hook-length control protein FliK [Ramlibacter tataouinensis]|uniref:flagellar hook-length control protein FliK n=1 Tax=Ramlibacter tataouinensis TaxID=94132 RepID=UPI0022F3D216|nr:flagellar hook-length control protein FliK [Ramlibacter tataouinensis]WBY00625.1 flagellar hook-length control protein FliK [Ramlibacter tataouinensis]